MSAAGFENLLPAAALAIGLSCDLMWIFFAVCGRGAWGVDDRRGVKEVDLEFA